jgi:hypothetical protein
VPSQARRWSALAYVGLAQLIVALDATIVSIALPSAQRRWTCSEACSASGWTLWAPARTAAQTKHMKLPRSSTSGKELR